MKKVLKIKFVHVDDFNRPIFKVLDRKNCYLCDTEHLFPMSATEKLITDFYNDVNLREALDYYGTSANGEPEGGTLTVDLELVQEA